MLSRAKRVNSISAFSCSSTSTLEFTVEHVYDIRSAVVCLLDAIAAMVETHSIKAPESYLNISQQIFNLDERLFKGIRDRYLWWSSTFVDQNDFSKLSKKLPHSAKPAIKTTSHHGFAIKYSRAEADRFLQSLLVGFEACKEAMLHSLKRKSQKETALYHEVLSLKDQIDHFETELLLSRDKLDDARRAESGWICKLEEMTEKLRDAEQKIALLEKSSDVLNWQKYVDESKNRQMKALEETREKYEAQEKQLNKSKENLVNKIKRLESELRKSRLRNEIPLVRTPTPMMEKLDYAKQQMYVRDQEIHILHKRMLEQQKIVAGCLHGLQEDFKKLSEKSEQGDPGKAFSPDPDRVQFQAKLRLLHDASVAGTLRDATSTLPAHYEATSQDCVPFFKQRKHGSFGVDRTLKKNVSSEDMKPRSVSLGRKFPVCIATETRNPILLRDTRSNEKSLAKSTDILGKGKTEHPQLVSPITGRVNLQEVMKHFPYLTVDQVSQQWENFRKYDKNRDLSLDLPELYEVITDVCGLKVSVSEMKEAMAEVDRDHSNNVDFYEYLKIAEMIVKKQGNAALFQSDLFQARGSSVSKECVIQ